MILLTGATGYIGRALLPLLGQQGEVITAGRNPVDGIACRFLDLASSGGYRNAVEGAEVVIHCGGLAHNQANPLDYQQVNERATMALADAALAAGVSRFIFLSSLNVVPFEANDAALPADNYPCPKNAYAQSKWRAERALEQLLKHSPCKLFILRPALVYDQELTANLATLARLSQKLPVALPGCGGRSMIGRGDLVRLIIHLACNADVAKLPVRIPVVDGERYNAARIASALGGVGGLALPNLLWQLVAFARDFLVRLPLGSTWESLAGTYWSGPAPVISDWAPSTNFEGCLQPQERDEG